MVSFVQQQIAGGPGCWDSQWQGATGSWRWAWSFQNTQKNKKTLNKTLRIAAISSQNTIFCIVINVSRKRYIESHTLKSYDWIWPFLQCSLMGHQENKLRHRMVVHLVLLVWERRKSIWWKCFSKPSGQTQIRLRACMESFSRRKTKMDRVPTSAASLLWWGVKGWLRAR